MQKVDPFGDDNKKSKSDCNGKGIRKGKDKYRDPSLCSG